MEDSMPILTAKRIPQPRLLYTVRELTDDDMDNILIGLQLLMKDLCEDSIQRIQADHLHHTLKAQREDRQKEARSR